MNQITSVIYQRFMWTDFEAEFFVSAVEGIHGTLVPHHPQDIVVGTPALLAEVKGEVTGSSFLLAR